MSNQSGGASGPSGFFASIYDAINNCNLEQLDAIIVAMFFFVGGGLLIGAIFLANLVGYFTPIAKTALHPQMQHAAPAHPYYSPAVIHPAQAQPYVAHQQVYPQHVQTYPQHPGQMHSYPNQAQLYAGQVQAYSIPVAGSNWTSAPQHFGRPRGAVQGWYPFAHERFGQAEASNQPPM